MLLNNPKYEEIIDKLMMIKTMSNANTWIDLDKDKKRDEIFQMANYMLNFNKENLDVHFTIEICNKIIDELVELDKQTIVYTLEKGDGNDIDEIPSSQKSSWQIYKNSLLTKGWTYNSVNNIEQSAFEILQKLSFNTENTYPIKGLAVGNVQSGKTANMAGLIAMAADHGFNCFIILSGMIDKLRVQTENRMMTDLAGEGLSNLKWHVLKKGTQREQSNFISNLDISEESTNRILSITLKQRNRLQNLFNALQEDSNKARQLKILIIDDEADQASINTNKLDENTDPTTINKEITNFVNNAKVKAMNYIAYTATPFANVLNESSEASLYPRNFITLLNPGEDYIGAKEIFGLDKPETRSRIPITREIFEFEVDDIREMQEQDDGRSLPSSFETAIQWFMISVAALRSLGYKKPLTMLVHTSFKKADHAVIAREIGSYLRYMKNNIASSLSEMEKLYEIEKRAFKRERFINSMPEYSNKDSVPHYPYWHAVKEQLIKLFELPENEYYGPIKKNNDGSPIYHKGIHSSIDNSDYSNSNEDEIIRLEYPQRDQEVAPAFLVVGGNTLSRGLTLEGLVTSYFVRNTKQADTLLQMARWLGYRKNYEIFPRVWLDSVALERFEFIAQMNEDFREEIKVYARKRLTPLNYAPRVKNSPDNALIRITSSNKSQEAKGTQFNFAGFNSQTIYFDNDISKLKRNNDVTKEFLNSLDSPSFPEKGRMLWREVDGQKVAQFLKEYQVCKYDRKMSLLPELVSWVEENSKVGKDHDTLRPWNVILSSKDDIKKTSSNTDNYWNIHGYFPKSVTRTKKKNSPSDSIANIGALRSPQDLLMDVDREKLGNAKDSANIYDMINIRREHGVDQIPQLIIYRIDKGEAEEKEFEFDSETSIKSKIPLDFPMDAIGINVMLPGENIKNKNIAEYLSVNPEEDYMQRLNEEEEIDVEN